METSNSFGAYVAGKPSIKPLPTLSMACEKINVLPVNKKILLKLKVSGKNGWFADKYKLELVPSSSKIKLSNTNFEIEEEWVIKFYIECSEVLNGYLQVKIDGKDSNRVNINFTNSNTKDNFSLAEINRLINENSYMVKFVDSQSPSEYSGNYCMGAAERGLSELLKDNKNFYSVERTTHKRKNSVSFTGKTAIDRGNVMDSLGFVKSKWEFDKYKIDQNSLKTINDSKDITDADNNFSIVNDKIITISDNAKQSLYNLFLNDISSMFGYHVYYFCIVGGFHTLILVIDSTNGPCESTYKMYDQHGPKSKGQGKLIDIGEGFRAQTSFNFANSCLNRYKVGKTKYWDSTKSYLWKIQEK